MEKGQNKVLTLRKPRKDKPKNKKYNTVKMPFAAEIVKFFTHNYF